MTVEYVFPTPIWNLKSTDDRIVSEALEWVSEQRFVLPSSERSNRLGYQSQTMFDFSILEPYWGHIHHRLKEIDPNIRYNNWWINISEKGSFNHYHVHPGCDLAVIWYLTDNYGTLKIRSPFQYSRCDVPEKFFGPIEMNIHVKKGDIVVFPSDIEHCVEPHEHHTQRVSISINATLNKE